MLAEVYTLSSSANEDDIKYVGITISGLNNRLYKHKSVARAEIRKGNRHGKIYNWIVSEMNKKNDIIIKLIETVEIGCWHDKNWQWIEKYWISQFKAWGFDLKNMTDGGIGNQHQQFSKESINKRSISNKGKKRSIEFCEKTKAARLNYKHSEETKIKMKKINIEHFGKKVNQYDKDGRFIKKWNSINEAALSLNTQCCTIANYLKEVSVRKLAKGFQWRYSDDFDTSDLPPVNNGYNTQRVFKKTDINGNIIKQFKSFAKLSKESGLKEWKLRKLFANSEKIEYNGFIYQIERF